MVLRLETQAWVFEIVAVPPPCCRISLVLAIGDI
jgi:hypothetical protein